ENKGILSQPRWPMDCTAGPSIAFPEGRPVSSVASVANAIWHRQSNQSGPSAAADAEHPSSFAMLLDAACPEPSPAPHQRNAAPAHDAPASSERNAGSASEAQPKQTAQNQDEKTCRSDANGVASQDPSAAGKTQEPAVNANSTATDDSEPGDAASNDGETD